MVAVVANAQSTYDEAIQQGDAAFNKGEYKTAINKYFAAEAFDPTKKDVVKEKVNRVFDKIEALRAEAINSKKEAEKQKALTDTALKEARKQTTLAIEAKKDAEKSLNIIREFMKRDVGKKYQGGIIFYSDSTREHGLIAAEKDLDSTYTWEQAKKACENYTVTVDGVTYDDWFLPSKDTLAKLYMNKSAVGGFAGLEYWSSSEFDISKAAWFQNFYVGAFNYKDRGATLLVRAVRAF